MILFITRLCRRYYLWSHRKYREVQMYIHVLKSVANFLIKTKDSLKELNHNLNSNLNLANNTATRKVLIEKYTQKDRERELINSSLGSHFLSARNPKKVRSFGPSP